MNDPQAPTSTPMPPSAPDADVSQRGLHQKPVDTTVYDITIIGAGPVGLYGVYYAGLRGASTKVIEALKEVGGGLKALYPEKFIYDIAGFPQVRAKDYVDMAFAQASHYNATFALGQRVNELRHRDDDIIELTTQRELHLTRTVIITAGMGAFAPRRLDLPGIAELEGRGIHYYLREFESFRHKRVLIVGGGDSAFDYALALAPLAKKVDLIHRSERFSAHEETVEKVKRLPVSLHYPNWETKAVHGSERLTAVTVVHTQTGEEKRFEVDACVFNLGFLANLGPIKNWGLEIVKGAIRVDELMRANIPGVYAAGDIVTHPGKIKLITTGCGEIAIAVNHAKTWIDPTAKLSPGHSSHMKH